MVDFAVQAFLSIMELALPVAIVFEFSNLIVGTFMRTVFGGKLWLSK